MGDFERITQSGRKPIGYLEATQNKLKMALAKLNMI
jgi:hypothetical protein